MWSKVIMSNFDIVAPEDFNCPAVGQDCTKSFNDALAYLASLPSGGTLQLAARHYLVPGGITESVKGLHVQGKGQPDAGPSAPGTYGTWIETTDAGAWCWLHENSTPTFNDYHGISFEGVGFLGNAVTAGGLWVQSNNNMISRCRALLHTTGIGLKFGIHEGAAGTDDASWNYLFGCMAQDNLHGYRWLGPDAGSNVIACDTLKTTGGGISGTGTGMWISAGNLSVVGCKNETNGTGVLVDTKTGVLMNACRAESNGTSYYLNGPSGAPASRITMIGCSSNGATTYSLRIGADQVSDRIVGFTTPDGLIKHDGSLLQYVACDAVTEGAGTYAAGHPV